MCLWTVRKEVWLQEDRMENHVPSWLNFIITKTVLRCWSVRVLELHGVSTENQLLSFQTILQVLPRLGLHSQRFRNCCLIVRAPGLASYFQSSMYFTWRLRKGIYRGRGSNEVCQEEHHYYPHRGWKIMQRFVYLPDLFCQMSMLVPICCQVAFIDFICTVAFL